ncbi:MAG: hypothetical protein N2515_08250 [Deltaproteobacteria bacterium]|nr:hypothetical protein [Deltaproteobacteria bacterium]MDW8246812.1 hypothetical protein [Sandaracinaceae bacterium]
MVAIVAMVVGVIVAVALFAVIGAKMGAKFERERQGAGPVEERLRKGMSPSVLGALIGVIPFLLFVVVLIVMVAMTEPQREGEGEPPSAGAH